MRVGEQFRCRVTPRLVFEGRELKPASIVVADEVHVFDVLWQQGDSDPYPGEWALAPSDESVWRRFASLGLAWLSSGDLTFFPHGT